MSLEAKPIEWWLEKANKKGYALNNLFERSDGRYQSNFRSRDNETFITFGYGDTPQEAVCSALRNKGVIRAVTKPIKSERKRKRLRKRLPK